MDTWEIIGLVAGVIFGLVLIVGAIAWLRGTDEAGFLEEYAKLTREREAASASASSNNEPPPQESPEEREKKLLDIVSGKDEWKSQEDRLAAFEKLRHRSDDEFIRAAVASLKHWSGHSAVIEVASKYLESQGERAVPALIELGLNREVWVASDILAKIGGKDARIAIAAALEKNTGFVRLEHALRWFDDPEGARKAEEMANARKAEVRTQYVHECVKAVFDRFAPDIAVITPEQVDSHYRDWRSDAVTNLMSGSLSEVRKAVEDHLMTVKNRGGFDEFRVRFNDHWQCVFVETYYQRMVNGSLVWRSDNAYSFAHT